MPAGASDLTSAGLTRWRERIRREEAVNARIWKDGFSVRASVRSRDVPARFKPHHSNPSDETAEEPLDEGSPAAAAARELRAALDAGAAPPQRRLLWPETSTHQVGWFAQAPTFRASLPPVGERGLGLGSGLVAQTGFGWLNGTGSDSSRTQEAPLDALVPQASPRASPQASSSGDRTAGSGVASTPRSRLSARTACSTAGQLAASLPHPGSARAAQEVLEAMPSPPRGRYGAPKPAGELPRPGPPADPWASGDAVSSQAASSPRRPTSESQRALEDAAEQHRRFQNGTGSRWYRPLGSCDEALFASAYHKSWGVPLFSAKNNN